MTRFTTRLDLLIEAMRRATPLGRRRFLAGHKRLMRRGIHLPSVPPGHRIIAGALVPLPDVEAVTMDRRVRRTSRAFSPLWTAGPIRYAVISCSQAACMSLAAGVT
jgi:hypothetical protein